MKFTLEYVTCFHHVIGRKYIVWKGLGSFFPSFIGKLLTHLIHFDLQNLILYPFLWIKECQTRSKMNIILTNLLFFDTIMSEDRIFPPFKTISIKQLEVQLSLLYRVVGESVKVSGFDLEISLLMFIYFANKSN